MSVSLIAALDVARGIGRGNQMPWHLPDDLRRFKALTLGKTVLMGGNTARSLGRALPGRRNLVLTRSGQSPFAGMEAVASLAEAQALAADNELMVIGGGEIYALALAGATRMYLTHVEATITDADAFFPHFNPNHWQVVHREAHAADARHPYAFEFVDYQRIAE